MESPSRLVNAALFVAASAAIWWAGTRLERLADRLAVRTGLGSAMTCLLLWGLVERENRTVGRLGWDSAAALVISLSGVTVLYFIQ